MNCLECGADNQNGKFCTACGTKLETQELWDDVVSSADVTESDVKETVEEELKTCDIEAKKVGFDKTIEENEFAKKDHAEIDMLISKMMETKSQKRRQQILHEFTGEITDVDAKIRFGKLEEKVNRKVPLSEKLNYWFGMGALVAFVVYMIEATVFAEISTVGLICALWGSAGIWIWPIWKVVLVRKRKKPWHYLNIKDI